MDDHEPRWFRLLLASRWPLAVVLAAWAVAVAAIQILRKPIPIGLPLSEPLPVRLEGAIEVAKIRQPIVVEPIVVQAKNPLPVRGLVDVQNSRPFTVDAGTVIVGKPVTVNAQRPLPVQGAVAVEEIRKAVPLRTDEPIAVSGAVTVNAIKEAIKVSVSGAIKSLNPFGGG